MINNPDILKMLFRYVSGDMNVASFRDQLIEFRIGGCKLSENEQRLLDYLEGRYSEFADKLVQEEFLKERVRELIQPVSKSETNTTLIVLSNTGLSVQGAAVVLGHGVSGTASALPSVPASGSPISNEFEFA